jgi:hypothetical protein
VSDLAPHEFRRAVWKAVGRDPDSYSPDILRWLANGQLCDPAKAFTPAGKLSWAETEAREASQLRPA